MSVVVVFHGYLKQLQGTDKLEMPAGQPVGQVLESLRIPVELSMLPVVNGRLVETDYVLQDGDRFELIPPIDGGCAGDSIPV